MEVLLRCDNYVLFLHFLSLVNLFLCRCFAFLHTYCILSVRYVTSKLFIFVKAVFKL